MTWSSKITSRKAESLALPSRIIIIPSIFSFFFNSLKQTGIQIFSQDLATVSSRQKWFYPVYPLSFWGPGSASGLGITSTTFILWLQSFRASVRYTLEDELRNTPRHHASLLLFLTGLFYGYPEYGECSAYIHSTDLISWRALLVIRI